MKKTDSYKIKHDYLFIDFCNLKNLTFDFDDKTNIKTLLLSKVMDADTKKKFSKLLDKNCKNILLVDDIVTITNPQSKEYKDFIISRLFGILNSMNYNVYY